jgi:hypothetical protein
VNQILCSTPWLQSSPLSKPKKMSSWFLLHSFTNPTKSKLTCIMKHFKYQLELNNHSLEMGQSLLLAWSLDEMFNMGIAIPILNAVKELVTKEVRTPWSLYQNWNWLRNS